MCEARTPMLQVALNGGRTPSEHPSIPRAPGALARAPATGEGWTRPAAARCGRTGSRNSPLPVLRSCYCVTTIVPRMPSGTWTTHQYVNVPAFVNLRLYDVGPGGFTG